jgi:hypothetical protein
MPVMMPCLCAGAHLFVASVALLTICPASFPCDRLTALASPDLDARVARPSGHVVMKPFPREHLDKRQSVPCGW